MRKDPRFGRGARVCLVFVFLFVAAGPAWGQGHTPTQWKGGIVTATDGAKIHYVEAGEPGKFEMPELERYGSPPSAIDLTTQRPQPSILFVPGWLMPAWIWEKQIEVLSKRYYVVAMDPRAQGESEKTTEGLYPAQMARDIRSVIEQLQLAPVVIVGWSMAVVETLAYVDQFGTKDVAGLVLVDELAGGQQPGDADWEFPILKGVLEDRKNTTDYFVRKVEFHKPQPEEYIRRVIAAAMSVPTSDAVTLLVGRYTADYRG
ncbi:MAG TPA: alpha/beta hydrolase, partial [Verrucomicrobiae bacterium]|nr:alpha/beta hydrolase [Verrucomicrobiae bacterium]